MARFGPATTLVVFLFLAASTLSVDAQTPTPPAWGYDDESGDTVTQPNGLPAEVVPGVADLRHVGIMSEDDREILVAVQFPPFDVAGDDFIEPSPVSLVIQVAFALEGSDTTYEMSGFVDGERNLEDPSRVYLFDDPSGRLRVKQGSTHHDHGVPMDVMGAAGLVRFHLPKLALRDIAVPEAPPAEDQPLPEPQPFVEVDVGSRLIQFSVDTSFTYRPLFSIEQSTTTTDRAPDAGSHAVPYEVQKPLANVDLRVWVPSGLEGERGFFYTPGQTVGFPFQVENAAPVRRVMNLTYTMFGTATPPAGYAVFGPTLVTLPARSVRSYTFYVTSPDPDHGDLKVRIGAHSWFDAADGYIDVPLLPGLALEPGKGDLRFVVPDPNDGGLSLCIGSPECPTHAILTNRALVPGFVADGRAAVGNGPEDMPLERRVSTPFAFDPEGDITIDLQFVTERSDEPEVEVVVELRYTHAGTPLLTGKKEIAVTTTGSLVHFSAKVLPEQVLQPGQGELGLVVQAIRPASAGDEATQRLNRIALDPHASHVKLPLVPVAPDAFATPPPGALQVHVQGGEESFVNPGRAHLFNMSVLNVDARPHHIELSVAASPAWPFQLMPSPVFDMREGQAVTVGLLVTAPATAVDGDTAVLFLNATDDARTTTPIRLSLTTITGKDLPDETGKFRAAPEDVGAIPPTQTSTPGVGVALAGLALAVVAWARRRA